MKTVIRQIWPAFFLVFMAAPALAQKQFVVVSYNVREGFNQDSLKEAQFVQWIKAQDPDVLALQELNHFTQVSLERLAARYGHPYAILSKDPAFPEREYYVGITSKYPITNVEKVLASMHHVYIYARVKGYHLFVTHLSPHRLTKRQQEMAAILARASYIPASEGVMIIGDLNTLSARDRKVYDTPERWKRAEEIERSYTHLFNLVDGKFDYSVMEMAENGGFYDAYYLINKEFNYTLPTIAYDTGKTFDGGPARIDYILVNKALRKRCTAFSIVKDDVTHNLSDHYPLKMVLSE